MTTLNETGPHIRASTATGWRAMFNSLENRSYRWFWISSLASFSGMQMQVLARGWLMYDMTSSPLALGLVSASFGLPTLLFSAVAGAIVDRLEKRNLLIVTQGLAALVNLAVSILISLQAIQVWHLMASAALTGVIYSFNMPARQSVIPELVEEHRLMNAISLSSGGMNLTRVVAPALGGILIGLIGVAPVYYMTVALFLAASVILFMIPPLGVAARVAGSTLARDVVEGFSYIRRNKTMMALLFMAFIPVVLGMPYQMLMPAFAVDVLDTGSSGLGFLMAATGIGALAGSLTVASLGDFRRKGMLLLITSISFGAFLVFFSQSNHMYLSLLLLLGVGATNSSYSAAANTLLLIKVEDSMRSRIMGIYMMTFGLLPLGVLPIGAIAEVTGVQFAVGMGGGLVVLFTLFMAFTRPELRKL